MNPRKATGDDQAASKSRAEEQTDDETEETPDWYKQLRRADDEMEAKRLAWLESKCLGRPDAEAKRQELRETMRKYGLPRPPGSVELKRESAMADDVDDVEAAWYVLDRQPDADARQEWMMAMGRRGLLGPGYVYIDAQTDYEAVRPILEGMECLNLPYCSYCCCRNKGSKKAIN